MKGYVLFSNGYNDFLLENSKFFLSINNCLHFCTELWSSCHLPCLYSPTKMYSLLCIVSIVLVLQGCDGFRAFSVRQPSCSKLSSLSNNNDHQPQSMQQRETGPLQRQLQSLPWLAAVVAGVTTFRPTVANAGKQDEANAKLAAYGLPPILFVPPGFTPLVSEFGRGNIREAMTNPIIVQFAHPGLLILFIKLSSHINYTRVPIQTNVLSSLAIPLLNPFEACPNLTHP